MPVSIEAYKIEVERLENLLLAAARQRGASERELAEALGCNGVPSWDEMMVGVRLYREVVIAAAAMEDPPAPEVW